MGILWGDFQTAVWGLPFWAILLSYGAIFLKNIPLKCLVLLGAGVLWISWGRDVRLWAGAFGYRIWSPLLTLPLMLLLAARIEAVARLMGVFGLIFALTLGAQSWGWWHLQADFEANLAENCTPFDPNHILNEKGLALGETPLSHWSITVYSIVRQGRTADKIWLYDRQCEKVSAEYLPITFWEVRKQGWFQIGEVGFSPSP